LKRDVEKFHRDTIAAEICQDEQSANRRGDKGHSVVARCWVLKGVQWCCWVVKECIASQPMLTKAVVLCCAVLRWPHKAM
jgi:hypothetical protein